LTNEHAIKTKTKPTTEIKPTLRLNYLAITLKLPSLMVPVAWIYTRPTWFSTLRCVGVVDNGWRRQQWRVLWQPKHKLRWMRMRKWWAVEEREKLRVGMVMEVKEGRGSRRFS